MHNHLGQQLQRTPSSTSDQDAIFSVMENSSSMAQDWMPSSTEYNLSSLGFDNMFQFNGQVDSFPIDHTEFASNDFGFPPGMSAIFDGSMGASLEASNGLESNGRILDNFQAHGDSNEGSNANSVADLANSNETSLEQNDLGLNMALKPSFMNRFKTSPSSLAQRQQQQNQFQEQGFNAQMDLSPSDVAQSQLFHPSLQNQTQDSHSHQGQPHTAFGFPQENVQSFTFSQHQQILQQPPLDEDMMSSTNQFMQNSPMSLANGTLQQQQQQQQQMMKQQQQKQFEDMLFQQQQQHQMGDTKGHFRHSSSPNSTDVIQENLRSRAKHQVNMHLQDSHSRSSIHATSVHPFSVAPMSGKAPTQKLTKRPSDLHVDISGRSSSFRLSGDVRAGDFRFGNDTRDGSIGAIGSAPLSPTATTASLQAPPTPAFFSPAFGDALSSPSLGLYHNSPFVHPDRNRASMQTDSSIGSFMDIHASSASSPSSLGSLNDVGHRMFRSSTDSMTPVDTIMPMDINFANMTGNMNYLDNQEISLSSTSLPGQGSFCPSPDHIDPHNVEVKPSFFSQYQEEQVKMELMTSPELDSNSNSVFNSVPEAPKAQSQPVPQKTARKRRSNEAVACSPSISSGSNSSSPPRNPRSRTISTTSSVVDEKEDLTHNFGPAASMRPIMLTHDLKPPSAKAMRYEERMRKRKVYSIKR